MAECQKWKLYYNCANKYVLCHKCKEHKLFQSDVACSSQLNEIIVEDTHNLKVAEKDPNMQANMDP